MTAVHAQDGRAESRPPDENMVTLTIDDVEVTVPKGTLVANFTKLADDGSTCSGNWSRLVAKTSHTMAPTCSPSSTRKKLDLSRPGPAL